jgi:hypothetical protein
MLATAMNELKLLWGSGRATSQRRTVVSGRWVLVNGKALDYWPVETAAVKCPARNVIHQFLRDTAQALQLVFPARKVCRAVRLGRANVSAHGGLDRKSPQRERPGSQAPVWGQGRRSAFRGRIARLVDVIDNAALSNLRRPMPREECVNLLDTRGSPLALANACGSSALPRSHD